MGGVGRCKRAQLATRKVCCGGASGDPHSRPAPRPASTCSPRLGRGRAEGGAGARPGGHVTGGAGIKRRGSRSQPELVLRPRPSV